MTVEVKINESEFDEANRQLQRLDQSLRVDGVKASLDSAAGIVVNQAKAEVPKPGYPGDKPGKKALRDTIAHEVRDYPSGTVVAVVGAQYPAGAHAHLVELGHEIWAGGRNTGKRTEPVPFMERAADNTKSLQIAAIVAKLRAVADGRV